ncbi:MAG: hypothetical protein GY753_14580, partial [Gammaproteobacteria bacterium]|nr:hypothetical protein [Gammaproteobacteria bacterium]
NFTGPVSTNQLTVSSGQVYFNGGLTLTGDLSVTNNAFVQVLDITASNITVSAATLYAKTLTVTGDLNLEADAVLTTPNYANGSMYGIYAAVTGAITVAETARIDVVGKGYPANDWSGPDYSAATRESSHGGNRRHKSGRAYGRYERARFAGSAGNAYSYYNVYGQGGGIVEIYAATLQLDGKIQAGGNSGYLRGGAGGSIHIEVDSLSGATTGSIGTNGAGQLNTSSTNSSYSAGAGGRISVYAGDTTTYQGSYSAASGSGDTAGAGTVYVQNPLEAYGHLVVDNANLVAQSGSTPLRTVGRRLITGAYETTPGVWKVEVSGSPWTSSSNAYGWGVDGLTVDLDASEEASPHYRVVSNTTKVLTLHTGDNLLPLVGNELVGVQTFQTLNILNGASLDLGNDRLVILDTANSHISTNAQIIGNSLTEDVIQLAIKEGGKLKSNQAITLTDLVLDYATAPTAYSLIEAPSVHILGDTNLTNARIQLILTAGLQVDGSLGLNGDTIVTTSTLHPLSILVGGAITVAETAQIDAVGKGYPANDWSGPDYSAGTRESSHGGNRRHE